MRVVIITAHTFDSYVPMSNIFPISYLDLHASNRFAQLEHDKDQARVNRLPAAGAGFLPVKDKQQLVLFFCVEHTLITIQYSTTIHIPPRGIDPCSLPLQPL